MGKNGAGADLKNRDVSTEKVGKERRQHKRISVNWAVDYEGKDTYLFASITDVSEMGIFVKTQTPEPIGTTINLKFSPQEGKSLELQGEVVWVNHPTPLDSKDRQVGMGVRFIHITDSQRKNLMNLVKTLAYVDEQDIQTPNV